MLMKDERREIWSKTPTRGSHVLLSSWYLFSMLMETRELTATCDEGIRILARSVVDEAHKHGISLLGR